MMLVWEPGNQLGLNKIQNKTTGLELHSGRLKSGLFSAKTLDGELCSSRK